MIKIKYKLLSIQIVLLTFLSQLNTFAIVNKPDSYHTEFGKHMNLGSPLNLTNSSTLSTFSGEDLSRARIQKCCGAGQTLNFSQDTGTWSCNSVFESSNFVWNIPVFQFPDDDDQSARLLFEKDFYADYTGFPNCSFQSLVNYPEIWFRVLEDGRPVVGLNFWVWPIWLSVLDKHCVDTVDIYDIVDPKGGVTFSMENNSTISGRSEAILFCGLENFEIYIVYRLLSAVCFIITAFGCFLTILIYLSMSQAFNLRKWTQISYFLAWLCFGSTEGARIFTKFNGLNITLSPSCFYLAVAAQYFSLVITTSQAVITFDMLCTFWQMNEVNRSKKYKTFSSYILFSWGVPLVALGVGLVIDHKSNPDALQHEQGRFKFGHYRCSSPLWELGAHIQCLMFLVSTIFFLITFVLIGKHFWTGRQAMKRESENSFFKRTVIMFFKLSLAMGGTLVFGVCEFYLGQWNPLGWIWVVERFFNTLMGLWLFLLFGCRRDHLRTIRHNYVQSSAKSRNKTSSTRSDKLAIRI